MEMCCAARPGTSFGLHQQQHHSPLGLYGPERDGDDGGGAGGKDDGGCVEAGGAEDNDGCCGDHHRLTDWVCEDSLGRLANRARS